VLSLPVAAAVPAVITAMAIKIKAEPVAVRAMLEMA